MEIVGGVLPKCCLVKSSPHKVRALLFMSGVTFLESYSLTILLGDVWSWAVAVWEIIEVNTRHCCLTFQWKVPYFEYLGNEEAAKAICSVLTLQKPSRIGISDEFWS